MTENYTVPMMPRIPVDPDGASARTPRRWPWIAGIVVAVAAGAGAGVAVGTPSAEENQAKIDAAVAAEVADQRAQLASEQDAAAEAQEAAVAALADAKDQAADAAAAQADADAANAAADARSAELDEREAALEPREADAARSTFGNGIHLVGRDINPGTYQAPGGSMCYWERLSGTSGEFSDLIANDLPSGTAVVTISGSDVAFKSDDCGTWTKIG
ncbi:MAG: hypothetical protein GXY65_09350 [Rhodococcus sp.]|uniref:hypothetical protein n=1 Tax=Rhodococcus TaxID=1827 RepID=UPI0016B854B6|nr:MULTISPECIES: hypothetical protein [Rhodococcus]NLV79529.1 hypothetical protein [Rhodococcus sp. (in: high G+C Gram-positive bacteria)]